MPKMRTSFQGLVQLLARSPYPEPEVFIRELLQNAHDSIQLRRVQEPQLAGEIHVSGRVAVRARPELNLKEKTMSDFRPNWFFWPIVAKAHPLLVWGGLALVVLLDFYAGKVGAEMQDTSAQVASPEEIRQFFAGQGKTVLTFIGYSDNGYEDPAALLERASSILKEFDPNKTIVNSGATAGGIGAVYPLAKQRGFMTTGIVSIQARKDNVELSPYVDHVFYVEDETWGGFLKGTDQLSPTSTAMVENSDIIVGIGGGEVGRDELIVARRSGKEVRYFPADMNHRRAIEKAKKKDLPLPTDFSGEAGKSF